MIMIEENKTQKCEFYDPVKGILFKIVLFCQTH